MSDFASDLDVRRLPCGPEADAFVQRELDTAAGPGFEGPLAMRLRSVERRAPFAYVPSNSEISNLPSCDRGARLGRTLDGALAAVVAEWLRAEDSPGARLLLMEESLGRRSDPAWQADSDGLLFHRDRVYAVADSNADERRVLSVLRRVSGYPGIGVLTEPPAAGALSAEIDDERLHRIVESAAGIVVRAWDGEAHVIACTGR